MRLQFEFRPALYTENTYVSKRFMHKVRKGTIADSKYDYIICHLVVKAMFFSSQNSKFKLLNSFMWSVFDKSINEYDPPQMATFS